MCNKRIDLVSMTVRHASALNCMQTNYSPLHNARTA